MPDTTIHYTFTLTNTEGTVGYVSCIPSENISFTDVIAYLKEHPFDEFMHKYALEHIATIDQKRFKNLLREAIHETIQCPVLAALLYEATIVHGKFSKLQHSFPANAPEELCAYTPLIIIQWYCQSDRSEHMEWGELFKANIHGHRLLPLPNETDLPMLPAADKVNPTAIHALRKQLLSSPAPAWERPPAQETASLALERLLENGIIADQEMRHIASLSPIALLRRWNLDIAVKNGELAYTLSGFATTYGRGLSLANARASYAMEMVERASSFATVTPQGVTNTVQNFSLVHARFSELQAQGKRALDPNSMPLEAPYRDAPLYWIEGYTGSHSKKENILVPIQLVYMFCNLDEPALFSAPGSTGLASGNILAEAKVAALIEILERDAEATKPYDASQCFTLRSNDEVLTKLFEDYAARGVNIMLQDITTEFGVPCYAAFVRGMRGEITKGTGAGLSAQKAVLSALTETPYPYPQSPPSGPPLRNLPEVTLEELPDFSMESAERNLELLELTLADQGYTPIYVELTRKDLLFPVVKALIPGLEVTADFDTYSRMSPRLFRNYLEMFSKD